MRSALRISRRGLRALLVSVTIAAATPSPAHGEACHPVADFSNSPISDFPTDWRPKEDRAREIYRVLEEGGVRFVRATAEGTGLQMGKEFAWDLGTDPVLAWKWRPILFPTRADERQSGRNDSVLGVYAVFPNGAFSLKTVKYIWSAVVPVGTTLSASMGLTRMIVLRSGSPTDPGWMEERVDVARDYQRLFGEAPPKPRGIAVLTDADDTHSRAIGDYAAFQVCPGPAIGSLYNNHDQHRLLAQTRMRLV